MPHGPAGVTALTLAVLRFVLAPMSEWTRYLVRIRLHTFRCNNAVFRWPVEDIRRFIIELSYVCHVSRDLSKSRKKCICIMHTPFRRRSSEWATGK